MSTALTDVSGKRQNTPAITKFFADEYVQGLLKTPTSAFSSPNEATKKDFETKTAPINVASAAAKKADVATLKSDAEWLSKNAKINLVAALRVVVVELQSRATRQLLGPLSSQDATNLQEAAGLKDGQDAAFLSNIGAADARDADEIATDFEKQDSRRRRLFETLLVERRCFMMAMSYANTLKLYNRYTFHIEGLGNLSERFGFAKSANQKEEIESLLSVYLETLTRCTKGIESGLNAVTDDTLLSTEEFEVEWLRTLLTEATHALSVIFQLVDSLGSHFAPPSIVSQWFSLMEAYNFFDFLQPVCTHSIRHRIVAV